jgi:GntR family transcriptional regulator
MMPKAKIPRYIAAKEYLLDRIRKMRPGDNQLESENQLTAKLGMSRETIRKAMTILIQEGVITRWHGKGNFGHPGVTNLPMRMDINSDFRRILMNAGYTVKTVRTSASVLSPSTDMINRMPEIASKPVVNFGQLFYADGNLAIQCQVELPEEQMLKMPDAGEYTENINEFLREYCNRESSHTTAWLKAGINPSIAESFYLGPETPLLEWEEVYYDIYDQRIGYIKIFFHPKIMDLSLLLKF